MDAGAELEALRGKVEQADQQARAVIAAEKAAGQELKLARANLARVEVDDPTGKQIAAARKRLERARVAVEHEPWSERRKLAQGRVGQAKGAVRRFVCAHLPELVEELEAEGEAAAARWTAAAEAVVAEDAELLRIRSGIAALWAMVTTPREGDVPYIAVAGVGKALLERSLEPPRLDRHRMAEVLAQLPEDPSRRPRQAPRRSPRAGAGKRGECAGARLRQRRAEKARRRRHHHRPLPTARPPRPVRTEGDHEQHGRRATRAAAAAAADSRGMAGRHIETAQAPLLAGRGTWHA